jgi:hypothetical protein
MVGSDDVAGAIVGWLMRAASHEAERCDVFASEAAKRPRYTIARRSGTDEWQLER